MNKEILKISSKEPYAEKESAFETREELLKETTKGTFIEAGKITKNILDTSTMIYGSHGATNEEIDQSNGLVKKANQTFGIFYKKLKKVVGPLSLAAFLFNADTPRNIQKIHEIWGPKETGSAEYITRELLKEQVPLKYKIIDALIEDKTLNGLFNLYNKFSELKTKRENGKMTSEEIQFKEKIAENILPRGYGGSLFKEAALIFFPRVANEIYDFHGTSLADRLKHIQENKKQYSKEKINNNNEPLMIRIDLFRKYLGLAQYYNSVIPSPYRPSKEKNLKAEYFCFDSEKMLRSMKRSIMREKSITEQAGNEVFGLLDGVDDEEIRNIKTFDSLESFIKKHNSYSIDNYSSQLGQYISGSGFDKERNEKYISYYDIWDLDPPILKEIGIDIDQFNFPFEIYGRIYESDFNKVFNKDRK